MKRDGRGIRRTHFRKLLHKFAACGARFNAGKDAARVTCPKCLALMGTGVMQPQVVAEAGEEAAEAAFAKDWTKGCFVCGEKPVVASTEMCGPCTFGEAATAGGNW